MGSYIVRIAQPDDAGAIDPVQWDALVAADPQANPFLRHAFLHALHASGAVTPRTGWDPHFVTVWKNDAGKPAQLVAAVPLYAKAHSYGEFVFDWAWAAAAERAGLSYYPKWLVAVPFTPVTGTRILASDATARAAAIEGLLQFAEETPASSLHVLFAPEAEIDHLARQGLLVRKGIQFHWHNRGYRDFEDFLAALSQPKRKRIRAERRKVREAGIRVERRVGKEIGASDWEFFFRCYANTYAEHGAREYLNLDFFRRIGDAMPEHVLLVLAWRGETPVASALGIFDRARGALYGRYWGAVESVSCLHFECCYYQFIEFAIEQGLRVCEGGAQGAHKLARGFDPVVTASAHRLRDSGLHAAVARFLAREEDAIDETFDELAEHRAWRAVATLPP